MKRIFASPVKAGMMRRPAKYQLHRMSSLLLLFTSSVVCYSKQPPTNSAHNALLSIAYYSESANNSVNSLTSLLKKDNYRNKIARLNNPTNNELGFSLKEGIMTALEPLLSKAKKTDKKKFGQVIENFLGNPEENGIGSVKKYMPSLGIFSTVMALVGNLVISEKNITREDLDLFMENIQQYFFQYEKLNEINDQFSDDVNKLLEKASEIKEDLKEFLVDCILLLHDDLNRANLKELPVEIMLQRYYDPLKMQQWLDAHGALHVGPLYPPDATTSVKLITSGIKRLQKEFESIYSENYKLLKELLASLKFSIKGLDQQQLEKTNKEIDLLYQESRLADHINLNIAQVDERMNTACKLMLKGSK